MKLLSLATHVAKLYEERNNQKTVQLISTCGFHKDSKYKQYKKIKIKKEFWERDFTVVMQIGRMR